jgi:hypothetical protein
MAVTSWARIWSSAEIDQDHFTRIDRALIAEGR